MKTDDSKHPYYITVLGRDHHLHVCEPHDELTLCGVKITTKKPTPEDITKHFSCYECTY